MSHRESRKIVATISPSIQGLPTYQLLKNYTNNLSKGGCVWILLSLLNKQRRMVQLILMSDCHFKWSFLHYGRSLAGHFKTSGGKKALAFFRETLIFLNSKEIGELKVRIISLNTSGFCQ